MEDSNSWNDAIPKRKTTTNPLRPAKTPQEKWAARALAILAQNDPDGARILNGVGFNSTDGGFGHSLAAMLQRRGGLTQKQWDGAIKICKKYHRQVGACPPETQEQKETVAGEISAREQEQPGRPVPQANSMTKDQAQAEARRRWGKDGFAHHAFMKSKDAFEVGIAGNRLPQIFGRGDSWEQAFTAADAAKI